MKNKLKNFLFKKRIKILRNNKGFSLVELLVAVGIMAVLAAIGVPAFNQYRADAAKGAFIATGTNVAKAITACFATKAFTQCNDLDKVNMTCSMCDKTVQTSGNKVCVNMESEIGGDTFKGCISVDASTGKYGRTVNSATGQKYCYEESGSTTALTSPTYQCKANAYDTDSRCQDSVHSSLSECAQDSECTSASTGNYCKDANGTCDTTNATCT